MWPVLPAQWSRGGHIADCCAHWSGHADDIWIVTLAAFNPISRRQECVETLNQLWVASEELTNSTDHTWSIDGARFEVLHDVQESVIHIRVLSELDFHLVEVAEGVIQDGLLTLTLLTLCHLLLLLARRTWSVRRRK